MCLLKIVIVIECMYVFSGEEQWGGKCRNGSRQSPIDLAKDAAVMGRYPSLYFRNYENLLESAKIRNTGHSCKFTIFFFHSHSILIPICAQMHLNQAN